MLWGMRHLQCPAHPKWWKLNRDRLFFFVKGQTFLAATASLPWPVTACTECFRIHGSLVPDSHFLYLSHRWELSQPLLQSHNEGHPKMRSTLILWECWAPLEDCAHSRRPHHTLISDSKEISQDISCLGSHFTIQTETRSSFSALFGPRI